MKNKFIAAKAAKTRFYYGWIITAITFICLFFTGPGQTYFISTFIDSYIFEFGWSRSTVSSLYSIATLISGILLFIIGRLTDKHGQKKMLLIVAFLLGASCIWNSLISNLFMLFIGFFTARMMGQGSLSLIPSTIIPHWFVHKRALAFSIMSAGVVVSSAVFPPVNTMLIKWLGWNYTWRVWACMLWLLFIPIVYYFLFNRPQDIGLEPYTDKRNSREANQAQKKLEEEASWTVKEAMSTKTFWFMLICQINLPMLNTGIVFHFMSIMGEKGFTAETSSYVLSIIAIVGFPSTFFAGYILDRIPMKYGAQCVCLFLLIGLIVLFNSSSIYTAVAFAVIQGIAMGFNQVFSGVLWPNYYGTKHLGSIRGAVMTACVIGAAIGPLPFGLSFDVFGRYNEAFIFMMLFPVTGLIAAFISREPVKMTKDA